MLVVYGGFYGGVDETCRELSESLWKIVEHDGMFIHTWILHTYSYSIGMYIVFGGLYVFGV